MSDPIELFSRNWQTARSEGDPNAHYCTLATVSDCGQVAMRTLVLREVVNGRFTIFTNATSPKWRDLVASSSFELLIFWPGLMQQYRVRGSLETVPEAVMKSHWLRKPYEAKILDLFYARVANQSSILDSREQFLAGIERLKQEFPSASDIDYPDQVKGVVIDAHYIEFWQGSDADRLHHRTLYLRSEKSEPWVKKIVVP